MYFTGEETSAFFFKKEWKGQLIPKHGTTPIMEPTLKHDNRGVMGFARSLHFYRKRESFDHERYYFKGLKTQILVIW